MYIKFPLSPRPSHQCQFYSIESKRLILQDFILESLLNGQSIVVSYQNENDLENLEEIKDLERINSISNTSFFNQLVEIKLRLSNIIKLSENNEKPLFGKQTFWELADLYFNNFTSDKDQLITFELRNCTFDADLYRDFKLCIESASKIYDDQVKYFLQSSITRLSSFVQNEGINTAAKYIDSFLSKAREIHENIEAYFKNYSAKRLSSFSEHFSVLNNECRNWKEMAQSFGLEPKEKSKQIVSDQLNNLASLCRVKTEFTVKGYQDLEDTLNNLNHKFQSQIEQEFKMLNFRNASDEEISTTNKELEELIAKINDSQLFKEEFSINSLSLKLCAEALSTLIISLEKAQFEHNSKGKLTQWMYFYNSLSNSKKELINACLTIRKHQWQAAFDKWYLYTLLKNNDLKGSKNIYTVLSELDQHFEQLRFDFSSICGTLMNEKGLSVRFVKASELNDINGQTLVWLGDLSHPIMVEVANNFQYILGLKPKDNEEESDILLHDSMVQAMENEDELEWRLRRSKILSTYFLDATDRISLYLTNDSNVIIESKFRDLKTLLEEKIKGGKYIGMRDNAFKVFTEFFLNDALTSYYFYDQSALSFTNEGEIYRHLSKIKALQQCGYFTIAIDRTRLYEDGYIQQILHPESMLKNA